MVGNSPGMNKSTDNNMEEPKSSDSPYGPTVSVVVPCRNEAAYIEAMLDSILTQEPIDGGFEILVMNGASTDGTGDILARMARAHSELRVINNPQGTTAHALNLGVAESKGRFIVIMGAHTTYGKDYLKTCIELLNQHPEVDCVGGPILSLGTTSFGHATAIAMSHPVGVGNARHRFPDYEGYAEGACFPMFRRDVFEKVGPYDENLIRNQDDDLNFRLRRLGGRIFISPRAQSRYFVRDNATALFRQYYQYGYWRVLVMRKHGELISLRQAAPAAFFMLLLVLALVASAIGPPWRSLLMVPPALYVTILLGVAISKVGQLRIGAVLRVPWALFILHFSYALGFLRAFVAGTRLQK